MVPIVEISVDDGGKSDMRLARLLERIGLRATFFIPSNCSLDRNEIRELSKIHTIGGHTVTHPADLKQLSDEDLWFEVKENRRMLKTLTGQKIEKFCYPRGRHDNRVRDVVKSAGYKTARTTVVGYFSEPKDPLQMHTSAQVFNRREYNNFSWQEYVPYMLYKASEADRGYFHLWLHSSDLDQNYGWWTDIADLFAFIKDFKFKEKNEYLYTQSV